MSQLVIGHPGAAGYRPEHTLASYELSRSCASTTRSTTAGAGSPPSRRSSTAQFLRLGVDGLFTDNADTARGARDSYALGPAPAGRRVNSS